jgi:hypothetical protein
MAAVAANGSMSVACWDAEPLTPSQSGEERNKAIDIAAASQRNHRGDLSEDR